MRDLSSDIYGTGESIQKHFDADPSKNTIIDLDLKGLPPTVQESDLKKYAGVKHVIAATIDLDKITNSCLGTGRVQLRLSPQEDLEQVKMNYLKQGFNVTEHNDQAKMKTQFTQEHKLIVKSPTKNGMDAKNTK